MSITNMATNVSCSRDPFLNHKTNALHAAVDLGYDEIYVKQVRAAKTSEEINRIMKAARAKRFGD